MKTYSKIKNETCEIFLNYVLMEKMLVVKPSKNKFNKIVGWIWVEKKNHSSKKWGVKFECYDNCFEVCCDLWMFEFGGKLSKFLFFPWFLQSLSTCKIRWKSMSMQNIKFVYIQVLNQIFINV